MMVHFRSRFSQEELARINEQIVAESLPIQKETEPPSGGAPRGKLLVDASCAPADISYPTDLKLLNEAREKTEQIIDTLYAPVSGHVKKPRTYRKQARKVYLETAKSKRIGKQKRRKAIGKQLRYIRRNLGHIDELLEQGSHLSYLSAYEYRSVLVLSELYRQQLEMYDQHSHRVNDRIVSLSQPHVRPIVRGKAGAKVEFGAKLSVSHVGGYAFLDKISWDAYNESGDLQAQIEASHKRFGFYPELVHADSIYRTRANRSYCKKHGIRLTGKPLGRPPKLTTANAEELEKLRRQRYEDEVARIPVEGTFGNAKRKGTLSRVVAKLPHTSCTVIHVAMIVLNLETALRKIFWDLWIRVSRADRRQEGILSTRHMALQRSIAYRLRSIFTVGCILKLG